MRLYTFTITPNNRKVEAFVRHFDLPVEIHHVSFKDKETQSPAYRAINPMGKVPALVDGDFNLWESNAILTYLATKFPATRALPADAAGPGGCGPLAALAELPPDARDGGDEGRG